MRSLDDGDIIAKIIKPGLNILRNIYHARASKHDRLYAVLFYGFDRFINILSKADYINQCLAELLMVIERKYGYPDISNGNKPLVKMMR